MVEVEYDDVRLSAVDARMGSEVFADERTILVAIATDPRHFLPDVGTAITDVVLASIPRMTDAAPRLASALGFVVKGELGDGLHESAVIATLRFDRCEREHHEEPLRSGSALRSA
jgi:hypothetical protein